MLVKSKQLNKYLLFLYLFFAIVGRIIPHPANVTPFTNISMLAGQKFAKRWALLIVLVGLFISDLLLAFIYHYPIFGYWTLFTYSGFLVITLLSNKLQLGQLHDYIMFLFLASVGFWLWTNLGSWLAMSIYPKSWQGLIACYTMALPFLRNQLIGDAVWFAVIAVSQRYVLNNYKLSILND
jgi:hypothetical protein